MLDNDTLMGGIAKTKIWTLYNQVAILSLSLKFLVEVVFFAVGLVLDNGTDGTHDHDADHVQVEPICEGICVSCLDLISKGEFVRETAGVKGDTTNEHVWTSKGCRQDKHMLIKEEWENSSGNGTAHIDWPEKSLALDLVKNHLVEKESKQETTPSCEKRGTKSLKLHHEEANDETDQNWARENSPTDPSFSRIFQERGVEEE